MDRRKFLVKSSMAGGGALLFRDPLIASLAKMLEIKEEEYIKQFSHVCDVFREEDLLHFRLYFVNLWEDNWQKLVKKRKTNSDKDASYDTEVDKSQNPKFNAYMLVRIPQQHIAENTINTDQLESEVSTNAFISGYSYLCFKLKDNFKEIKLKEADLLDWSKFDLITLDDLGDLEVLRDTNVSFSHYPENIIGDKTNQESKFFFDTGGIKLPVSLIEIYKLFLSPIAPSLKGKRGRTDLGYVFSNPQNKTVEYLRYEDGNGKVLITRPWENDLHYSIQYPDHQVQLPPHFKAVAHQDDINEGSLIPNGYDRNEIVEHSLLDFKTDTRDIISDYFKIGVLGLSTYLQYDNLYSKKGSNFVGWKQEVKNGRDNYVEIISIGIDIRTGKKVLVSKIGERKHHKGKSLFIERYFMSYVDLMQTYDNKDFPYSKSEIMKNGFYFKPVHFDKDIKDVKNIKVSAELKFEGANKNIPLPFIPVSEDSESGEDLSSNKVRIIYNECLKYDKQGEPKKVKSHIAVFLKTQFEDNAAFEAYKNSHEFLTKHKDYKLLLQERVGGEKFAYVKAEVLGGMDINKNTSLSTDCFQFTTKKASTNFYDEKPLSHHLVYAQVTPPQTEGVSESKYHPFTYDENFIELGEVHREIFDLSVKVSSFKLAEKSTHFKYRSKGIEITVNSSESFESVKKNLNELENEYEKNKNIQDSNQVFFYPINASIETDFNKKTLAAIPNVIENNAVKALIHPDPVIRGLSILDQGITLAQDTEVIIEEIRKGDIVEQVKHLKPADVFKGMKAEVFKGVKIVDILKQVIPMEQSPVFEVIEEAQQGVLLLKTYKTEFENKKKEIELIHKDIETKSRNLFDIKVEQLEKAVNKWVELERETLKKKVQDLIITPYELAVDDLVKKAGEIKDLIGLNADSEFNLIQTKINTFIDNAEKKGELAEAYLVSGIYQLRQKNISGLKKVLDYLKKNSSKELDHLTLLIQEQLNSYRKEFKALIKVPASTEILNNITFSTSKDEIDKAINLLIGKPEVIRNEIISKIRTSDGQVVKLFDKIKNNVGDLSSVNGIKPEVKDKYSALLSHIDFILYYYYESKLVLEEELNTFNNQMGGDLKRFLEARKDNIKKYQLLVFLSELKEQYDAFEHAKRSGEIKEAFKIFIKQIDEADEFKNLKQLLIDNGYGGIADIEELYKKFKAEKAALETEVNSLLDYFNLERKKIQQEIDDQKTKLSTLEYEVRNFVQVSLESEKNKLKVKSEELLDAIGSNEEVSKIQQEIDEIRNNIQKILESNKKKVNYKWEAGAQSFSNFKSNFVSFYKTPYTSLKVDAKSEINYELSLDQPPKYNGTEFYSVNKLENFTLSFFDIIAIDFANIKFETGSKIKTDFEVNIKDVKFSGALTFIQTFESLLSVLNFIQNIVKGGIQVDYDFNFPEIPGGAFNFLNGKFHFGLFLPLGNDQPIRIDLGVNSPNDMFLITYSIFGGRGCFQLGLTPKDGVVKVLLVLEFGGVVLINAGVAKGFAYLFAGIYYRKLNHSVEIRGYLVAGGCLSIAGLIRASVTFVMGLKGDGNKLKGYCSVTYKVVIGKYFEKKFRLPYRKNINNASKKNNNNELTETVPIESLVIEKSVWKEYLTSFKAI